MGGCTSKHSKPKENYRNDYPTLPQRPKSSLSLLPPTTPFLPTYTPSSAHPTKTKTPSMPLRFLKKSLPPPSPAKHIRVVLRRRKPKVGIAETEEDEDGVEPDKGFGFLKELRSKLEIGEEVRRGHFCVHLFC